MYFFLSKKRTPLVKTSLTKIIKHERIGTSLSLKFTLCCDVTLSNGVRLEESGDKINIWSLLEFSHRGYKKGFRQIILMALYIVVAIKPTKFTNLDAESSFHGNQSPMTNQIIDIRKNSRISVILSFSEVNFCIKKLPLGTTTLAHFYGASVVTPYQRRRQDFFWGRPGHLEAITSLLPAAGPGASGW